MTTPKKLIVVGMRYQDGAQEFLMKANPGVAVSLRKEQNAKSSNGYAYSVYLTQDGVSKSMKLGYIREADVGLLGGNTVYNNYIITNIQTNYLVLEKAKSEDPALFNTTTGEAIPAVPDYANSINPCAEVIISERKSAVLTEKEYKKMNTNSMRDSFFREVKNAVLDITTGGFGIVTADGISVYKDGAVSVNPIVEMGVKVPAFAMRVDVATLTEGDIIINGTDTSFYKGKTETGYEVVAMNGEVKQVGAITNLFFGKNTVLAIKNMMAGTGMNPMMMALMMGDSADGKGIDMKTMMLMSMMGNQSGGTGMDSNMLMMAMMMGK